MAQHTIIVESASQPAAQRKRRKAPIILAGIGLIALVPVVGSTFAASITLNSGSDIEFGQGNQATVTCDSDGITVTPVATFDPATDQWSYLVQVTGISDACDGETLTVKAWDADSAVDTWQFAPTGEDGVTTTGAGTYLLAGSEYTASLTGTTSAADVQTITVETSN